MTELHQRQPRVRDEGFLAFVRKQPCCLCGTFRQIEAAHIRIGHFGLGMKPDDELAVPLCSAHHRTQHSMNERKFWDINGDDPFRIAAKLYDKYLSGLSEKALQRLLEARSSKPKRRKQTHRRPAMATTQPKRKITSRPFSKVKRKFR